MNTLLVDEQTSYFHHLINKHKLDKYFFSSCPAHRVEIAIIKTPTTVNEQFYTKYPNLKMIIRAGSGYDNIDVKRAAQKKIHVCNTPEANTLPAFEHTISFILAMIKQHRPGAKNIMRKKWKESLPWNLEVNDLKVLVVGVGRIGSKVAKTMQYLGSQVWGVDPYLSDEQWQQKQISPITYSEGLQKANLITYHCPLKEETVDYFSHNTLAQLKQPVWIVNTARGVIVNEDALFKGLQCGLVLGAGLDVYCVEPHPQLAFAGFENVYLTPHTGAYTEAAKKRLAEELLMVWKSFVFEGKVVNCLTRTSRNQKSENQ